MNNASPPIQPASVLIDGKLVKEGCGVQFDHPKLEVILPGRQRITIDAFDSLMPSGRLPSHDVNRITLDGPRLGLYHDTADVREGPFINHFLNHIEISIAYPSDDEAHVHIFGSADLAKSSFDSYWYTGPTKGEWSFEASFAYKHPSK